jgi:DNA-binding transcriptional LysR family regulator
MAQFTLKQLQALVEVADQGSFRAAAQRLNTTQPNISARISALETGLGLHLMDRDAGSVRMTPMGQVMLGHARGVLTAMDGFIDAAGKPELFQGVLRLGVTEMIVHTWLGDYLTRLRDLFPNVEVELTADLSVNLTEALVRRDIDLALQTAPFAIAASGQIDLGRYPMAWVAAPNLGLSGRGLTMADLAGQTILTHSRGTQPFDQIAAHLAGMSGPMPRLVPSSNMATCLQLTADGLGVACVPRAMAAARVDRGELEWLDYPFLPDPLHFMARFDAETSPQIVVRAADLAEEVSQAAMDH